MGRVDSRRRRRSAARRCRAARCTPTCLEGQAREDGVADAAVRRVRVRGRTPRGSPAPRRAPRPDRSRARGSGAPPARRRCPASRRASSSRRAASRSSQGPMRFQMLMRRHADRRSHRRRTVVRNAATRFGGAGRGRTAEADGSRGRGRRRSTRGARSRSNGREEHPALAGRPMAGATARYPNAASSAASSGCRLARQHLEDLGDLAPSRRR